MHCSSNRLTLYRSLSPTKPPTLAPPCRAGSDPNPIFRRYLTSSSLLLLLSNPLPSIAAADKIDNPSNCPSLTTNQSAFLDISVDGEPVGRIVIGLYSDAVPAGAARFAALITGKAGASYRRKEFVKIMPNYVQHGGIRRDLAVDALLDEWETQRGESCRRTKNAAGSVGIIVRDPSKPPPKPKLVARKGKLEIDQEEVGVEPNGSEFVIAVGESPELDEAALVVGRVVEGMEVVERIGRVPTVQDNSASPYFRVAKLIGDKRAVVAERGFNRPYSKVVVTNCGLLG